MRTVFIGPNELQKVNELMAGINMRPVALSDIGPELPLIMVGVRQLLAWGEVPKSATGHGMSVIQLASEPIGRHPNIPTREVVFYHQLEEVNQKRHFIDKALFLLSWYEPRIMNSSETRFFVANF